MSATPDEQQQADRQAQLNLAAQQARERDARLEADRQASAKWEAAHENNLAQSGENPGEDYYQGRETPLTKGRIRLEAEAARSRAEAEWNRTHPDAGTNPYRGDRVNKLIEDREAPYQNSPRYAELLQMYSTQHNANVSSAGILVNGVYISGVNKGMKFTTTAQDVAAMQARVAAAARVTKLPEGFNGETGVRAVFRTPVQGGLFTGLIRGLFADFDNALVDYLSLGVSAASPQREGNLYGTDADATTAIDARFLGTRDTPLYDLEPGTASYRFSRDEFGKVLRGGNFTPAESAEGIPANPKMGSGDYRYVGEYQYKTGEIVSRYYEANVGSFIDIGEAGAAGTHQNIVRSGGSPGSYYSIAPQQKPAISVNTASRNPLDDIISAGNRFFQSLPVLSGINTAGRIISLENEIRASSANMAVPSADYNGHVASFQTEVDRFNAGGRTNVAEYNHLVQEHDALVSEGSLVSANISRIVALQNESNTLKGTLVNQSGENNPLNNLIAKPVSSLLQGFSTTYDENITKPYSDYVKSTGLLGEAGAGFVSVPSFVAGMGSQIIGGGEILSRNLPSLVPLAVAGLYLQGEGMYEGFKEKPLYFATQQAGTIVMMHGMSEGVRAVNPIGFGVAELPSFEKGVGSRYYGAYIKMPLSTMERGGVSLGGFARIYTLTDEIHQYTGAESLRVGTGDMSFRSSIGTFSDVAAARRYFNDVANSGKRTFLHATGDLDFINKVISDKGLTVGEKVDLHANALFFGSPDVVYSRFLKGAKSPTIGGGILRFTTNAEITPEYLAAAERVARGEPMGATVENLSGGLYPGLRAYAGKEWKGVGLENEFIVPKGTKLNVTGTHWVDYGGKRIPLIDVTMNPVMPGTGMTGWAKSRLSTIFNPKTRTEFFLGSPADIMRTHDINIESPFAMDKQWTRETFVAMNSLIMSSKPSLAQAIWQSVPDAIEASKSRFYHPVQRELMGEFPTPAAGRATMEDVYGVAESHGSNLITGGSRTIKAYTGEYGRGASLQDIDFWTYKVNMENLYGDMLSVVERDYPGSSDLKFTYLKTEGSKPGFSIVTGKDYFLSAHRIETFPFVREGVMPLKTIGGHTVLSPSPQKSLRMKTSGMFAGITQKAGGELEFSSFRIKDAVDAYSLSRVIAHDLYTPVKFDIGGILSKHKMRQVQKLDAFSNVADAFIHTVGGEEGQAMFAEIPNTKPIIPQGRAFITPAPVYDLLSGQGIVSPGHMGMYQRGVQISAGLGLAAVAPVLGLPKLIGGVAGVVFWDDAGGLGKGLAKNTGRLSPHELKLYREVKLGADKYLVEKSVTTDISGELKLDENTGTEGSVNQFSDSFKQDIILGGRLDDILSWQTTHTHPRGTDINQLRKMYPHFEIPENLYLRPSIDDLRVGILQTPFRQNILTEHGSISMQFPDALKTMDYWERKAGLEPGGKLLQEMRSLHFVQSLADSELLSPKEAARVLKRGMGDPGFNDVSELVMEGIRRRPHNENAAMYATAKNLGIDVRYLQDIDITTGIGKIREFASDEMVTGERLRPIKNLSGVGNVDMFKLSKTTMQPVVDMDMYMYPTNRPGRGRLPALLLPVVSYRYPTASKPAAMTKYPALLRQTTYPKTIVATRYPTTAAARYPTVPVPKMVYPVTVPKVKYPNIVTPNTPGTYGYPGRVRTELYTYPVRSSIILPPMQPMTFTYAMPRKRHYVRSKRKQKAEEWYIWHNVPTLESTFGTQNIKTIVPKMKLPKYKMPRMG